MKGKVKIKDKLVGEGEPVFIVAEAGSNHNRKLEQAKRLIDVAADAGADVVKFQTFSADKIVARVIPKARYMKKVSKKESVYEIFKRIELPREWHRELAMYAGKKDLIFLSSPFDEEAVDLLDDFGVPAFKVASGELTNLPLIKYMATKGKPMIVSTGAATASEIREAISTIKGEGNNKIILLHCVANYPAANEDANLLAINTMRQKFKLPVGYSDHTLGIAAPIAAAALGAVIIEKHFTLNRKLPGPDHFYALEPSELKTMVEGIRAVEKLLGSPVKRPTKSEQEMRKLARRSIFAKVGIPAGTTITKEMLTVLRPAIGLEPKYLEEIVSKKARLNIKLYEPITWDKICE
ncbi:MAG: N-acetylneuraminate synthase [Candidatus Hadarchaeaceae archaeon]